MRRLTRELLVAGRPGAEDQHLSCSVQAENSSASTCSGLQDRSGNSASGRVRRLSGSARTIAERPTSGRRSKPASVRRFTSPRTVPKGAWKRCANSVRRYSHRG